MKVSERMCQGEYTKAFEYAPEVAVLEARLRKLETKNAELRLVLEEYPPQYMMENDVGVFFIYCRACEGKWRHFEEIDAIEPQHEEYCEVQKALAALEDGDE